MMGWNDAIDCLPGEIAGALNGLSKEEKDGVREIRLRADEPVSLSTAAGERWVTREGRLTALAVPRLLRSTAGQVEECFMRLCEDSIHAHQQEILQGYLLTGSGGRVGLAGRAVMEGDRLIGMRQIRSLCLRVSCPRPGCADELAAAVVRDGRICSTLICGEPSSGKTSLLRDLAEQLAGGKSGRRFRVVVVDERGELSDDGRLTGCDVLERFPKARGLLQAVRCLAPDAVIFDE
ncbi:MAG: hypothetical protein ACOYJY_07170, partial [Acutalibacteraceae bacterium]